MTRAYKCCDCGKRIGYWILKDVGIGIPMAVGEKITDKEAKQVTREVAYNIRRPCWICGDCVRKEINKQGN